MMSGGIAVAGIAAARAPEDADLVHVLWFQIGSGIAILGVALFLIGHIGSLFAKDDDRHIVVQGGRGGDGGGGGIGDVVHGGHGGGGGGAAHGPGSVAEGGKGGSAGGPSAFEALARASLGMGYPLDEFIQLAGFDPLGPELDRIGRAGDADQPGGPGLVVITCHLDDGRKHISVLHHDGRQCEITARGSRSDAA